MKSLLEILDEAKSLPNMGEGKLLLVISPEPFAMFNATIGDPFFALLIVKHEGIEKTITFTEVESAKLQADWAD